MADDLEFFDILYQQWAQTTLAEKSYWKPTEHENLPPEYKHRFSVDAIEHGEESVVRIAAGLTEADAEFICGLHGALPDLIRRLHDATDEADRADTGRDDQANLLAEALVENQGLQSRIHELERQLNG